MNCASPIEVQMAAPTIEISNQRWNDSIKVFLLHLPGDPSQCRPWRSEQAFLGGVTSAQHGDEIRASAAIPLAYYDPEHRLVIIRALGRADPLFCARICADGGWWTEPASAKEGRIMPYR
jgi:hypothetical protein